MNKQPCANCGNTPAERVEVGYAEIIYLCIACETMLFPTTMILDEVDNG